MTLNLTPTEDMTHILDAATNMLRAHYPLSRLREAFTGEDLGPLAELGAFLLACPETEGGAGFTILEEARLHIALGAHLVSAGALATSVGLRIARGAGLDTSRISDADALPVVCGGVGNLLFEPDGATHALLSDPDQVRLIPLDAAGWGPVTPMGHGRPMARLNTAAEGIPATRDECFLLYLLTSAQLLGVARGARDLAVSFALTREQFGQPIGAFQAIKHHCANMTVGVEKLSALVDFAAIRMRDGAEDAAFQLAALARLAPRIALQNARTAIQIHGGIGFSAQADAHLFLKQAHVLRAFLGAADFGKLTAPMHPTGKD